MKSPFLKTSLFAIALALIFTGCNLFDNAADVSFGAPIEGSLLVSEAAASTGASFSDALTIDATSNTEVAKYKDKIKNFTVNKITYKITDYTGDEVFTT